MSADRYIAVCHPISSPKWRTPMISRVVALLAWTCSILLIIPIIEHATEMEQDTEKKSCVIDWTASGHPTVERNHDHHHHPQHHLSTDIVNVNNASSHLESNTSTATVTDDASSSAAIFTTYTFVFSFAIPLSLILIFYCLVIQKLKTVGPKNKSKEKKRSHRKVTNLVLTVIAAYVICWLPYWITQIAMLTSSSSSSSTFVITLHLMASCLSYSNSAMNPILYAFLSDNFKKSFLKACTCATGKDANAALHLENSVFPRKGNRHHSNDRYRPSKSTFNLDEEYDMGPLVSRGDQSASAITMTSRTNITSLYDSREAISREGQRNGSLPLTQPTSL